MSHTVFEHHIAQGTPEALAAFLHEYRITFPVGIDERSGNGPIPKTMQAYQLQGTPSLILIDKEGSIAHQMFGSVPDLKLGADIKALIQGSETDRSPEHADDGCDADGCSVR